MIRETITRLPRHAVMTVHVTVAREFFVRLFVAKWLLRCACRVLGCGIEFVPTDTTADRVDV